MLERVPNNAKAVHYNIKNFLKNEITKIKAQENYILVVNFLFFIFGIIASYYGFYWLCVVIVIVLLLQKLWPTSVLLILGLSVMQFDLIRHNQYLIQSSHKNIEIIAIVEKSSEREYSSRKYTISHINILNNDELDIDGKLMLYCNRCKKVDIPSNSVISLKANLVPLPEKVYPTGYNVEGKYKFQGYSGFAFANKIKIITKEPLKNTIGVGVRVRSFFLNKLDNLNIDSQVRAIVEAIFLGERSRISQKTNDILRKVGLSHIIAISGMHVSIIMMIFYQLFLRVFALSKKLRLRYDLRRLALLPALLLSFCYLTVAGMPISGLRSFVMISFAVIIYTTDAKPKLFASVLFAGFVLLALMPHVLFFASFQLSFLAVLSFGLVLDDSYKYKNMFLRYFYSIVKSSLVITVVTAPVVIYHFGGISLISPIVNIIAIPLLTFVIMPFGLLYFVLTIIPANLWFAKLFANVMIESIQEMLKNSELLSSFTFSFLALKDMPLLAVFLVLGGILTIFIIKSFLKIFGFLAVIIGLAIFIFNQTPDIIANANSFVFREGNKYYIIGKKEGFAQSVWRSKLGLNNDFLDGEKFCNDEGVCMTEKITYVRENSKLNNVNKEKCTDILVSRVDVYNLKKLDCKYKVILTRDALEEKPYIILKYSEIER